MDSLRKGSRKGEYRMNQEEIYECIKSMLEKIVEGNSEFVCSTCMELKEDLLDFAETVLDADYRADLEEDFRQAWIEWTGEEPD